MSPEDTQTIADREIKDEWFGGYVANCGVCAERLKPDEVDDGLCVECKEEGW